MHPSTELSKRFGALRPFWATLALLAAPAALRAQQALPYLEVGAGEKQGDFGTPIDNTLWMGYATYGAATSRWDASVTVPWLDLRETEGGNSAMSQGIGDVLLRGAYRILPENVDGWSLDGVGAVKLPTASSSNGLGTGSTDFGGFLALHHRDGHLQWNLMGGWIAQAGSGSSPSPTPLTSGVYDVALGGAWYLQAGRVGLSFEARGPVYQGTPGAREASVDFYHLFNVRWAMKAVATAGLNDGAPKHGIGIAVIRYFP